MLNNFKRRLLFILLVLFSVSLNLFLRAIYPPAPPSEANIQPSIIVNSGLLVPIFSLYTLLVYSGISLCFFLIQRTMRFGRIQKGIMYGFSIGGIWILGMFESCVIFGNSFQYELISGIVDAFPIILFSIGLSLFTDNKKKNTIEHPNVISILIIALSFTICRFIGYEVLGINSGINERFVQTLIWTILMGMMVGIMYFNLQSITPIKKITSIFKYSLIIYGINIFLFNFALILIIKISIYDLLLRTIIDIFSVTLGIYFSSIKRICLTTAST